MADPPIHSNLNARLRRWWQESLQSNTVSATLRHFLAGLWEFTRDATPSRRRQRYGDVDYDWDHRVDTTAATVGWRERLLGTLHSPYQPTEPALFREMLDDLTIDSREFTFIDLGSGKGRTLLMASDYPFRRIIGVELLRGLHAVAQQNIEKYKSDSQLCFRLECICADAREFKLPPEPTVLFLFNPFPRAVMQQVIHNIEQSLQSSPRGFFIIYHNPEHEQLLANSPLFRKLAGTHQYSIFAAAGVQNDH